MIDAKHFIKEHAARNIPLSFDEAYALGEYMMQACHNPDDRLATIQSVSLLSALHNQATYAWRKNGREVGHDLPGNAADQIAGICAAVFEKDIAKSESGFLEPKVPFAMDNCGMGGDLILTANISTIAAFIAAAAGIPMCKHGSSGNATPCGSSNFIDLCGINRFASKGAVEKCVEELSFGYTDAEDERYKHIHMQTHRIAQLPHMNDIIGPITNPLSPKIMTRRILGGNHLIPLSVIAQAYQILNGRGITKLEQGFIIRGFGSSRSSESGMDELSICEGGTELEVIKNGFTLGWGTAYLSAKDFGVKPIPVEFVSPPAGMSKGEFSMSILKAEAPMPCLQMAIANAALLFYLAEKSRCLKECYLMAQEVLMSRGAYKRMLEVREMLPAK